MLSKNYHLTLMNIFVYVCTFYLLAVLFNRFLGTIPITPNDDTCVYFNYAKNVVEGNIFAYDSRNIPSEGFSSLIFLLLLVPFEYFGINLLFAAILINILSICLIIWFGALIYKLTSNHSAPSFTLLFAAIFASLLTLDTNLSLVIGWGFETLLSPAIIFAAFYFFLKASSISLNNYHDTQLPNEKVLRNLVVFSFIAIFLSILIRPENILLISVLLTIGMILFNYRITINFGLLAFALCLTVYLLFKFFYFADLFPTGFYRKVHPEIGWPGYEYVKSMLVNYQYQLYIVILLSILNVWISTKRNLLLAVLAIFISSAFVITTFFIFVVPIIAHGNRYLIFPIVVCYFLLAYLMVYFLETGLHKCLDETSTPIFKTIATNVVVIAAIAFLAFKMGVFSTPQTSGISFANFYKVINDKFDEHLYVRFGRFLKNHLHEPQNTTLVFGDAGCTPYASGVKFIDSNGLTEPYVAHLFKIKDKSQVSKMYTDYVLSFNPDIIVIGIGANDSNSPLFANEHSPFGISPQLSEYDTYRNAGFVYLCSVQAYYDLHLAVRPRSPQFAQVVPTLREYCHNNGYTLKDGITKIWQGNTVHFPGLVPGLHPF